jgi:hypothetical protein
LVLQNTPSVLKSFVLQNTPPGIILFVSFTLGCFNVFPAVIAIEEKVFLKTEFLNWVI